MPSRSNLQEEELSPRGSKHKRSSRRSQSPRHRHKEDGSVEPNHHPDSQNVAYPDRIEASDERRSRRREERHREEKERSLKKSHESKSYSRGDDREERSRRSGRRHGSSRRLDSISSEERSDDSGASSRRRRRRRREKREGESRRERSRSAERSRNYGGSSSKDHKRSGMEKETYEQPRAAVASKEWNSTKYGSAVSNGGWETPGIPQSGGYGRGNNFDSNPRGNPSERYDGGSRRDGPPGFGAPSYMQGYNQQSSGRYGGDSQSDFQSAYQSDSKGQMRGSGYSQQPQGSRLDSMSYFNSQNNTGGGGFDYGGRGAYQNDRGPMGGDDKFQESGFDDSKFMDMVNQITDPTFDDVEDLGYVADSLFSPLPHILNMTHEDRERVWNDSKIQIVKAPPGMVIPNPIITFKDCGFPPNLEKRLTDKFKTPTPIQQQGWPIAMSGMNIIGIAETGSGKTLAYLFPGVVHTLKKKERTPSVRGPHVLILSPTRELSDQIRTQCSMFVDTSTINILCLIGGERSQELRIAVTRGCDIVVASPGKLLDFVQRKWISLSNVSYFVLDEADRLLDMGFAPQIRTIARQVPPSRQTLMWSATWARDVEAVAASIFTRPPIHVCVGGVETHAVESISHRFIKVYDENERWVKFIELLRGHQGNRTLVFSETKRECDSIMNDLNLERNLSILAKSSHGDCTQFQRQEALNELRSGVVNVLITTALLERGMDIEQVALVVNFRVPRNVEAYVHRVGRTGRAGATGEAVTFYDDSEARIVHEISCAIKKPKLNAPELQTVQEEFQYVPQQMYTDYSHITQWGRNTREEDNWLVRAAPMAFADNQRSDTQWDGGGSTNPSRRDNNDWGESTSRGNNKDDDWGQSASRGNNKDDEWGQSASRGNKNTDDWGQSSSRGNNRDDDWGQSASRGNNKADDWGQSASRGNNKADDWGQSASRGNNKADDWGQSASRGNNKADDWGQSASRGNNKADDWGQSASRGNNNADDWGQSASRGNNKADDWGQSASRDNKVDNWEENPSRCSNKVDNWEDNPSSGGYNRNDRSQNGGYDKFSSGHSSARSVQARNADENYNNKNDGWDNPADDVTGGWDGNNDDENYNKTAERSSSHDETATTADSTNFLGKYNSKRGEEEVNEEDCREEEEICEE